jgi:transglycosylase-like protein with SLT domain
MRQGMDADMTRLLSVMVFVVALGRAEAPRPPDRMAVRSEVRRIAAREGIDPLLAEAVAEAESAYNAWAVSPKGAVGVMQLMPKTAGALGVRDPWDVQENVTAGVRYLRYLHWYYRGDLRLTLAAYNAGPGAVAKHGGLPPYTETRQYVMTVLHGYDLRRTSRDGARRARGVSRKTSVCGGSEVAYDSRGRLYIRAQSMAAGCVGQPLR